MQSQQQIKSWKCPKYHMNYTYSSMMVKDIGKESRSMVYILDLLSEERILIFG